MVFASCLSFSEHCSCMCCVSGEQRRLGVILIIDGRIPARQDFASTVPISIVWKVG